MNEARYARLFGLSLAGLFALVLALHAIAVSEASFQGLPQSDEASPEMHADNVPAARL
jgi:hypothetical protein